jgi:Tfp pilus assembly protein FimT
LLEVLLTVALVSLAVSIGLVGIAGLIDAQRLQHLESLPARVDAEARLLAIETGPCELTVSPSGSELRLHSLKRSDLLAVWTCPQTVQLLLATTEGGFVQSVRFNREGRSPTYRVRVKRGEATTEWSVQGGTGWVRRLRSVDREGTLR